MSEQFVFSVSNKLLQENLVKLKEIVYFSHERLNYIVVAYRSHFVKRRTPTW